MSKFTNRKTSAKGEADAYVKAVLDTLGDQEPLPVLERLPAELDRVTGELSSEQLCRPQAPGKWSILEVIQHLADSELVWAYRLKMIVSEDRPQITGYDQDAWAKGLNYGGLELEGALETIRVLREGNVRLIKALSEDQLRRTGVHSERGEETIAHMVCLYAGHDLVHRKQIERIRSGASGS